MIEIEKNDIPVYILNRDRFNPLVNLVESFLKRGYTNVTIIDNDSTYPPLLEWYDTLTDVVVYKHERTPSHIYRDNIVLNYLAAEGIEPFATDVNTKWFVYTDSDIVPLDMVPENFLNDMIHFGEVTGACKIGLGIKIDDIPDHYALKQMFVEHEQSFWDAHKVNVNGTDLHHAPIDTSLSIHRPGSSCGWTAAGSALRCGYPYVARHMPFYYDTFNLPEDEEYYMNHFDPVIGYGCSAKIKKIRDDANG